MKKFIIIATLLVTSVSYSQTYRLYMENPAYNIAFQDSINEFGFTTEVQKIGFEGAPVRPSIYGHFSMKNHKKVGFSFVMDQYRIPGFSRIHAGIGYTYNIVGNIHVGLLLLGEQSKFRTNEIQRNLSIEFPYSTEPVPGMSAVAGFAYTGDRFIASMGAKKTFLGSQDLNGIDQGLTTNVFMDIGFVFEIADDSHLLLNIGTEANDFVVYKSIKTLPIHVDVRFNIQSFQTGLSYYYPGNMRLFIAYQGNRVSYFIEPGFAADMLSNSLARDYVDVKIGVSFPLSLGGKNTGRQSPNMEGAL